MSTANCAAQCMRPRREPPAWQLDCYESDPADIAACDYTHVQKNYNLERFSICRRSEMNHIGVYFTIHLTVTVCFPPCALNGLNVKHK